MKIYVISRANACRFFTAPLLRSAAIPFTLVVDNAEQAASARALGFTRNVVQTNCAGIVETRNFINQLHGRGWYIGLDDNIKYFTAVKAAYRKNIMNNTANTSLPWRRIYNAPCRSADFVDMLALLTDRADTVGAKYGGVATMENPFFRATHYSYRRFVKTKAFIMRAEAGIVFKHAMCHDSYATALAIAKHGCVVVNNYAFYHARHYEQGGLGTRKQREEKGLLTQLQACVDEFPGLVALARGANSALRVCKVTDLSVNRWRAANGYLVE